MGIGLMVAEILSILVVAICQWHIKINPRVDNRVYG